MTRKNNIDMEFDEVSQGYYVVWEPVVIGMGQTEAKALEDLREAAHFCVDSFIDLKFKDINTGKEQ
jgi:orotidine-5'-phosphate decarboxylase